MLWRTSSGHLLLGEAGHPAAVGIMHVPWQTKELEQIKRGVMFFLPEQAELIRAQVLARWLTAGQADRTKSQIGSSWLHRVLSLQPAA
jgi:hypothetical protein